MKAKIVNDECVVVMSHREAALITAVFGYVAAGPFADEVGNVCETLGPIYGYPLGFAKTLTLNDTSLQQFDAKFNLLDIDEEHYA